MKRHPFIVVSLALALLGLVPGFVFSVGAAADEPGDPVWAQDRVGRAAMTCKIVQRDTFGQVADGYIWEAMPETSYNDIYLYTGCVESSERRSLIHFSLDFLPQGAVIQSAMLGLWQNQEGSGETISIYRITEPWAEGEPTWASFADSYDDSVAWGSFAPEEEGLVAADVTGLVSAWADGEFANNGMLLRNTETQAFDRFKSSEIDYIQMRPWLTVCYVVNEPPVAEDDLATTDEDTPVDVDVLANDSDPDEDPLTVSDYDASTVQGGTASCISAGVCTYTPPQDFNGIDSFTYTADDGNGGTDTATVTVTVDPVNDLPVAVDDTAITDQDALVYVDVLANDSDPDGDPLAVSDFTPCSTEGGTASCTEAGVCTYTPPAGFHGVDTFGYVASDGNGGTDAATVTVTVVDPGSSGSFLFMPLVVNQESHPPLPAGPDLVVEHVAVTSDSVEVVIENQGDVAVLPGEAFWVDLYVDPDPVPTAVNETWSYLCSQGIVWGVTAPALPLEPGDAITLTLGDAYYREEYSNFPASLPAGTPIYVQVDSANAETTYGAVLENHEMVDAPYNNITGPILSTLHTGREDPPGPDDDDPQTWFWGLPPRP